MTAINRLVNQGRAPGNSYGLPSSLWRATVREIYGDGTIAIVVPRLFADQALQVRSAVSGLSIGDSVIVGAVENSLDDLLVVSRTIPFAADTGELSALVLTDQPTLPAHATRKDYVDYVVSGARTYTDQQVATRTTPAAVDAKIAAIDRAPSVHTHTAADITDATTTGRNVLKAVDAAAARTAIGAGTSSLAIGTTATTAKAGNYFPAWSEITSIPTTFAPSAHTHQAVDIANSTATGRSVLVAVDAAAARTAIGAGTSSLVLGTTATTAMAGNKTYTKADVGLGNVDNTTDLAKPVSTAVQTELTDIRTIRRAEYTGTVAAVSGGTGTDWPMDTVEPAPFTQGNTFATKSTGATKGLVISEAGEYDIIGTYTPASDPGTAAVTLIVDGKVIDTNVGTGYGTLEKGVNGASVYITAGSIVRLTAVSTGGTAYNYRLRISQGRT